jgi:hypothetical protein
MAIVADKRSEQLWARRERGKVFVSCLMFPRLLAPREMEGGGWLPRLTSPNFVNAKANASFYTQSFRTGSRMNK